MPAHGKHRGNETQHFCTLPDVPERAFNRDVSPLRRRLIRNVDKKWVNGTKLRYCFFDSGSYAGKRKQLDIVRDGFAVWQDVGIGVAFEEVQDMSEAEIRIGFLRDDGAWSYIGRDLIDLTGSHE